MVSFTIKALPEDADTEIRAQLPGGRGREALATKWLCIHALGPQRALAILHIEQTAIRNAQRRRGETELRVSENIMSQYSKKVDRFYDVLQSYHQQRSLWFPEWNEERIPDYVDVVKRLTAILFYVGQDFLRNFNVNTLNDLSNMYCNKVNVEEVVAWECTWRVYDERSFSQPGWREAHTQEAAERERYLIHYMLSRYGHNMNSIKTPSEGSIN
jgi:hypothetical protein